MWTEVCPRDRSTDGQGQATRRRETRARRANWDHTGPLTFNAFHSSASLYSLAMATISDEEKSRLLRASSLFGGLNESELDAIASVVRLISVNAREQLFHKGDDASHLYIVVRGRLKALATSTEGHEIVFNIVGPGEVLGELAVLNKTARTATVQAIDVCELLSLRQSDLFEFLRTHPDAAIKLCRVLAARVSNLSELVTDMQFLNLPFRLAKKLIAMGNSYGQEQDDGLRIKLKLSQEEWGDLVGATRESINKQFRAWTKEGLIHLDRGCIVLAQREAIARLGSYDSL